MKRSLIVLGTLLVALYLGSVPASAQGRPTTAGVSHGTSSHAPSTATGRSTDTSPNPNSSPSTVLGRNTSLAPALVKALANSGITTVDGTTITASNLATICDGSKTLGRCIAALHVSHNLGGTCTFDALRAATSLGAAIHTCNPNVDPKAEASKAIKQGNADIKSAKS